MRNGLLALVFTVVTALPVPAQPRLTVDWVAMADRLVAQLAP